MIFLDLYRETSEDVVHGFREISGDAQVDSDTQSYKKKNIQTFQNHVALSFHLSVC
jgi:hypothetical protein